MCISHIIVLAVCDPGMCGTNCTEVCGHCDQTNCSHIDGTCEDGCEAGYLGRLCKDST